MARIWFENRENLMMFVKRMNDIFDNDFDRYFPKFVMQDELFFIDVNVDDKLSSVQKCYNRYWNSKYCINCIHLKVCSYKEKGSD
jgi:hypothetical protein